MTLSPGARLGPYEILAPLGAGGMGEVYRALDPRLRREVALKILPVAVAGDPERLRRFEREARAVAGLSHPNLVVVHDVGVGEPPYLVMELVAGESLRERLRAGRLAPARAARIAAQIARALAAAHASGVVHRDLKPENVVVDRQDHAKVLDFGLARLAMGSASTPEAQAAPTVSEATFEGTVLGTPGYMAPEQVRGETADGRADIFALGAILYEMLTGRRAFGGASAVESLHAILHQEPAWDALPAEASALAPLVRRCLEKAPEARFQSAADLAWELEREIEGRGDARASRPHRPAWRTLALGAGLGALLAAAAAAGWWAMRGSRTAAPPNIERMTRLVSSAAHEFAPVLSPDGKWVAYLSNARGPTDIWVKFIAGVDPVNLTATATDLNLQSQDYIGGLAVSPDGAQIAFQANRGGDRGGAMWVIPAPLGGPPRMLLPNPAGGMQWSPDGTRVAYVKAGGPLGDALAVADADGQNEVEIVKRTGARHIHWIRWDVSGRFVYFNYGFQNHNGEPTEIYRAPATPGPIERIVETTRRAISPFPSPDGRGLFYAGNPDGTDLELRWRELPSGRDARVTTGVGVYDSPTMSADGRRLVGTVLDFHEALARVAVAFDRPVQFELLTDGFSGDIDPSFSPDGTRLVFSSSRAGNRTLWTARHEASGLGQIAPLTSGTALDARAVFSPDGREIAFVSDRGGRRAIWLVSAEAGTPRKLADADVIDTLSWSPDGRRLVFSAPVGDAPGLMTIDVANGEATRVPTPAAAALPAWSPGEDVIAYMEPRGQGLGTWMKFVRSTGEPLEYRGGLAEVQSFSNGQMAWSPDGARIAVEQQSGSFRGALWIVEPGGSEPYRKLLDLPDGVRLRGITWSRDGSSIVVGKIERSGDIFLAELSERR